MVNGLKVEEISEGSLNLAYQKPRVLIAFEENDLLDYVNFDVAEPSDDIKKAQRKNKVMAKKIMSDSKSKII